MTWLSLLKVAARAQTARRSSEDGGLLKLLLPALGVAALIPVVAIVVIVVLVGGAVAVALTPFTFFFGMMPQSAPAGLTGPPAIYWSAYVAAQSEYHIPMAGLLALSDMTSGFDPTYSSPDGNAGIIAMPPSLFATTATAHAINGNPCLPQANSTNNACTSTVRQEMDAPTEEIPVAAAALADLKFTVPSGKNYLPGDVDTAIKPFVCGQAAVCDLSTETGALLQDMSEIYQWLQTPSTTPTFRSSGSWNQVQVGTFPLPASTLGDPFPWGQCTWWAYYNDRVPGVFGNADEWPAEAAKTGVTVIPASYGPAPGDVVVLGPGGGYSPVAGHVAEVVAVYRNAAGQIDGYEVSQANVPTGADHGSYADILWPDPNVMDFLPSTGQWFYPLSSFQQTGV
jgi:hypothetical protein